MSAVHRLVLGLRPDQITALQAAAGRAGLSIAAVVRDAVDAHLGLTGEPIRAGGRRPGAGRPPRRMPQP